MYMACGFAESHGDTSLLSFAFLVRFELLDPHAAQHSGVTFFQAPDLRMYKRVWATHCVFCVNTF